MRLSAAKPLLLKLASPDLAGEFTGIAATWETDRADDCFELGCFAESISAWRSRKALPPLLWCHDPREPIGALIAAEETDRGLEVTGRLALGTGNGKRAHELMKTGSGALSLSVGLYVKDVQPMGDTRLIKAVDWVELSVTPTPCQPGAIIETVKSLYGSRKEFEHAARNALGLSANQAKRLSAGGWAALARDEPEEEPADLSAIALKISHLNALMKGR